MQITILQVRVTVVVALRRFASSLVRENLTGRIANR